MHMLPWTPNLCGNYFLFTACTYISIFLWPYYVSLFTTSSSSILPLLEHYVLPHTVLILRITLNLTAVNRILLVGCVCSLSQVGKHRMYNSWPPTNLICVFPDWAFVNCASHLRKVVINLTNSYWVQVGSWLCVFGIMFWNHRIFNLASIKY